MKTDSSFVVKFFYVLGLSLLVFYFNGVILNHHSVPSLDDPFLSNKYAFSFEIAGNDWRSPDEKINHWFFNQPAPYKYRILGKLPIFGTFKLLEHFRFNIFDSFYYSYLTWCFIFLFSFLFIAGNYVTEYIRLVKGSSDSGSQYAFYTSTFFLATLPPVLFAFKFPIHGSPNDLLGYALIALSLLSLLYKNYRHFITYTLLGLFCRETNLIVLLPFLFMTNWKLTRRFSTAAAFFAILLAYRLIWKGSYNPLTGAAHNYTYIWESILFLFLVFCHFWVLGVLQYINEIKQKGSRDEFIIALNKSYSIATIAVLAIVFLLARAREIRIEFILYFLYVPFGVLYLINNGELWLRTLKSFYSVFIILIPAIIVFIVMASLTAQSHEQGAHLLRIFASFYGGFGGGWKTIFYIYLFSTLLIVNLDMASRIMKNRLKLKGENGENYSLTNKMDTLD